MLYCNLNARGKNNDKDFLYLVAVVDWHSRKVLSWRLSNTMDTSFCLEALDEAIARYGAPEMFNAGQGSQFTSEVFTNRQAQGSRPMASRSVWTVKVKAGGLIMYLWNGSCSLKYEEVYLKAYKTPLQAESETGKYFFRFYHEKRRHQGPERRTPDEIYDADLLNEQKAAWTGRLIT